MIKKIRQLIVKEWVRFFLISTTVLFLLLTVANLISGLMRGNVTISEVIFNHLITLPNSSKKILPISCLIASLFSINKLKSRNELTAIFAAGFPRYSFFSTILQISIVVAFMQFVILAFIEPYAKKHRDVLITNSGNKFRSLKSKGLLSSTIGSGKAWYRTNDYFVSFTSYDKSKSHILGPTIYYFTNNKLQQIIQAERAIHKLSNYWTLTSGTAISLLDDKGYPLQKNFKQLDITLHEVPADFAKIESDITTLSIVKLRKYIDHLERSGIDATEYFLMYLDKFSTAINCIVFALLASLGALNPNRRNSSFGKNVAIVFVFTMVFWLINSYFLEQGKNSMMNPYVASFSIPILFSILLIVIFHRNRKLI